MQPKHRIERTRNRHSRAVLEQDTIVIRLARNLSVLQEQEHIENLLRRMHRAVLRERKKESIRPFQALLDGEHDLSFAVTQGRAYRFLLTAGTKTRTKRIAEGWAITVAPSTNRRALHRKLWTLLCKEELPHIRSRLREVNDAFIGVGVRSVRLSYMTTQWGSCTSRGDISINAALLFLPPPLLQYVIIHELTHRKVRNHSAAFWNEVEHVLPQYHVARSALINIRLLPL